MAFDRLAFDANAFDTPTDGRFGLSLPDVVLPRPRRDEGLVWLAFPRYFGLREAVSGGIGSLLTAGGYRGHSFASTALGTGGVAFPFSGRLKSITSAWSLLWYGSLTTLSGSGEDTLLSVPVAGTWVSPYSALLLRRLSVTSRLYAAVHDGTNTHNGISSTGVITTGEKAQLYAVTYNAGQMTFYKDGASAGVTGSTNGMPGWGAEVGVVVGGRHPTDVGNSPIADCVMAAIYNRALTPGEIADIARHPARLVESGLPPLASIAPPPPPPIASFSATPASGVAPLTVDFADTSTGVIAGWAWDFQDDGSADSAAQNPQHVYATAGTYTARLTVSNTGGSDSTTRTITVSPPPPPPPGIIYTVEIDFARDGAFAHARSVITSRVIRASWSIGMSEAFQEFAAPSRLVLTLDNADGAWSPDSIGATYHGLLAPGVLLRIRATHDGVTRTLWTGKISAISAPPGRDSNDAGGWREVSVTAEDPMRALLDVEYAPPLLLDVRTDEAIRMLFEAGVLVYPYDKDYFRWDISRWDETPWYTDAISQFDEGYTLLPWVGDNLDPGRGVSAQAYLREILAAEAGGRFFWDGRAGKFTFHNRYRDNGVALVAALGGSYLSGARAAFGEDLANVVTVQYEPRAIGTANTVLWEIDDGFSLRPGQERTLTARYRDPNAKDAKVSATVVLPIQPGDLIAHEQRARKKKRTDPDPPPGREVSGDLLVTVQAAASSARVTVRNPLSVAVDISLLRLRGTPLTTFARDEVTVSDAASIVAYDLHESLLTLRAIDDPEMAEGIAGLALARRKRALNRWKTATLTVGSGADDADSAFVQGQIVGRAVGDRVRLTDAWSGHDAEYIIVGEAHRLEGASATHAVTWTLKPAALETWFRWDVSRWDSEDVIAL